MPRKPRLHLPGGLYHVILRGNSRQSIFFDELDRVRWESYLAKGLERYGHRVHAYCWMTNHVHLALQNGAKPLARLIRWVASQYARSTNKKLDRSGHFFERRYRAILVQSDAYMLELIRYIHLNPVRAGLVSDLLEYPWTSHRAYLGEHRPPWLTVYWALAMFSRSVPVARRHYAEFMAASCETSFWEAFRQGGADDCRLLGNEGFRSEATTVPQAGKAWPDLDTLVSAWCKRYQVTEAALSSRAKCHRHALIRAEIGQAAMESGVATLAEVARRFGRSDPVLARTIARLRRRPGKKLKS